MLEIKLPTAVYFRFRDLQKTPRSISTEVATVGEFGLKYVFHTQTFNKRVKVLYSGYFVKIDNKMVYQILTPIENVEGCM